MNKLLIIAIPALLLTLLVTPVNAQSDPCCGHVRVTRVTPFGYFSYDYYHRPVPPPPPPPQVIHYSHFARPHFEPPPRWSLGLHVAGSGLARAIGEESGGLGGVGFHLRYRHYRWGTELAVDALGNRFLDGTVTRVSLPIQGSALLYLVPRGVFNLYLLAGLRLQPTIMSYKLPNLTDRQTFLEYGAHVGLGAELLLGRHFALTADVRGFGTIRDSVTEPGAYYAGLDQAAVLPDKSLGLQVNLGASIRF
jgi:hypothetical protein